MIKRYWDNINFTYGTRTGRTTFVGSIDPFELGVAESGDRWLFQLPSFSELWIVDNDNISSLQAIIDNAQPNARIYIQAGTYRIGNLRTNAKPVQIVGEIDSSGNNLVNIYGSTQVLGSSFVDNSGVWELSSAPSLINAAPVGGTTGLTGYYPEQNFQLWDSNNVPYNSVPNANLSDNTGNHSLNSGTIRINDSQPTGNLEWGVYSHFIANDTSNASSVSSTTGTDGLVLANLNLRYFTGNRNVAVIGRRYYFKKSDLPFLYHCYYNIKIEDCRADAVSFVSNSEVRNVTSLNNSRGSIRGCVITPEMYDAGWDETQPRTKVRGCRWSYNNYGGSGEGDSTKTFRIFMTDFLECEGSYNGITKSKITSGNTCGDGFWMDNGGYNSVKKSQFFRNARFGVFLEIGERCDVEDNEIFENTQVLTNIPAECYNSTFRFSNWRRNNIKSGLALSSERAFIISNSDRGSSNLYSDYVWDSNNITIEDNIIELSGDNYAIEPRYRKSDAVVPFWKEYTDRNITIQNNQYNVAPTYRLFLSNSFDYANAVGLTAIQALEDKNTVAFDWEDGSTII